MYAIVTFIDVIEGVFTENSRFMYGKIAGKIDVKIHKSTLKRNGIVQNDSDNGDRWEN